MCVAVRIGFCLDGRGIGCRRLLAVGLGLRILECLWDEGVPKSLIICLRIFYCIQCQYRDSCLLMAMCVW